MTTEVLTNHDLCMAALRKLGVVAFETAATADEIEVARAALSRMLKAWQNRGDNLWAVTSMSVTLTTALSYALSPVRPLDLQSVRFKRSGTEIPMVRFNRDEYDTLPNKATKGTPTCFYYDRQKEAGTLFIWPSLAVASGETLEITYLRELGDVALDAAADVPSEWYDAVAYGLASRLSDDFMINAPNLMQRAEIEYRAALDRDREGSVFFYGEY